MISKDSPEVKYNVKIQINDFDILQTVGMGTFGRVRLCKHKKTKKIYVLKMLKKFEIIRMKQIDHIYNEYIQDFCKFIQRCNTLNKNFYCNCYVT